MKINKKMLFISILFALPVGCSAMNISIQRQSVALGHLPSNYAEKLDQEYTLLGQLMTYEAAHRCLQRFQPDRARMLLFAILHNNARLSCNQKCELIQIIRTKDGNVPDACFDAIERLLMRGMPSHELTQEQVRVEMARTHFE